MGFERYSSLRREPRRAVCVHSRPMLRVWVPCGCDRRAGASDASPSSRDVYDNVIIYDIIAGHRCSQTPTVIRNDSRAVAKDRRDGRRRSAASDRDGRRC